VRDRGKIPCCSQSALSTQQRHLPINPAHPAEGAIRLSGRSRGAGAEELKRALKIEKIADRGDIALVCYQVDSLARSTKISLINALGRRPHATNGSRDVQNGAIGRAAFPIRYELIQSPSPGQHLQAIASLQVHPDFELLEWLAGRIRVEKPFIAYHAIVALNTACRCLFGRCR